jgi:hydroxyacylglutathione hydrolase
MIITVIKMIIKKIVVGYLKENRYILEKNNKVIIIDPGDEFEKIDKEIHGEVIGVLLTHSHFDHVGALNEVLNKYHVPVNKFNPEPFNFEVIYTPGHSWDSKTYYFKNEDVMFTGDFIFYHDLGRTDLKSGSQKDMQKSLNKIKKYPLNIKCYPGHGQETTLQEEINNINYFSA